MIGNGSYVTNIVDEVYDGSLREFRGQRIVERNLCGCEEGCDGWDNVGWFVVLESGAKLLHVKPHHIKKTPPERKIVCELCGDSGEVERPHPMYGQRNCPEPVEVVPCPRCG